MKRDNRMEGYGFSERFAAEAGQYSKAVGKAGGTDNAGNAGTAAAGGSSCRDLCPGRVVAQHKNLYSVVWEKGSGLAEISGKLRYEARTASDLPAVGDFVMLDRGTGAEIGTGEQSAAAGNAIIHKILTRKSLFVRKAAGTAFGEQVVAANIDIVFICMALNKDFNLRRLERYLAIAWDSGATPVAVLTKADLCSDLAEKLRAAESVCMGVELLVTSAMEEDGYQQILNYITVGKTVALIGSSGVGKSTLINRLMGEEALRTNGLRNDDKGRHTTTRRELILLPSGGMVVDTPGMRELGIWDSQAGVDRTFADIEALMEQCRFHDCSHRGEPGCAVRAALADGTLPQSRWLSYQKLKQEADYVGDKAGYLVQKEEKFKSIAKINKKRR